MAGFGCAAVTYQGCAAEGVGAAQPNGSTLRRVRGQGCAALSLAPPAHVSLVALELLTSTLAIIRLAL